MDSEYMPGVGGGGGVGEAQSNMAYTGCAAG